TRRRSIHPSPRVRRDESRPYRIIPCRGAIHRARCPYARCPYARCPCARAQRARLRRLTMPDMTFTEATIAAMQEEMRRDPLVFAIGEDMALQGGVFGQFKGLPEEFGVDRVLDTPISETAIVGAA